MEVNSSISGAGPAKQADNAVQGSLPQWCRRPEYGACPRGVATAARSPRPRSAKRRASARRPRRAQESEPRRRQSSRPCERRQPAANDEPGDGDGADHAVLAVTTRPRSSRRSATWLTEYLNARAVATYELPLAFEVTKASTGEQPQAQRLLDQMHGACIPSCWNGAVE